MIVEAASSLFAAGASLSAGIFGALIKHLAGRCNEQTAVLLLNAWVAIGVGIASIPLWFFYKEAFAVRSLLLGVALAVSTHAYIRAVGYLGLTIASALTFGTGCLVSSICNIQLQNEPLQHRSIGAAAVFVIVVSLAGTVMTGRYNMFILTEVAEAAESAIDSEDEADILEHLHSLELAEQQVTAPLNETRNARAPAFGLGMGAGIAGGVIGGCAVAFSSLPAQATAALGFVVGSMTMAVVGLVYTRTALTSAALEMAPLGVASGAALLAGNFCRLLSEERSDPEQLSDTIILSTAVLLTAAWGIGYHREITPRTLPACLISGLGVAMGATMLGLASQP